MKDLNKHNVYLIGIGGIGMSALAKWFYSNNYNVVGYDKTNTLLTKKLMQEGIIIYFEDDISLIPADFAPDNTLIIYTPAIPADHIQYNYFLEGDYEVKKRAEVLGMISAGMFTVAIAGTHGKTTTSSMIAHVLKYAGMDVTAFLGGIATNYGTNLLLGNTDSPIAIIEADEYDRSFLQLSPDIEVITSIDADHLDVYGDKSHMEDGYKLFFNRLKPAGICIVSQKAQKELSLNNALEYGSEANINASNLRIVDEKYTFDYVNGTHRINEIQLNLPGEYNAENAVAAITVATNFGVADGLIKEAFETYQGVKRRFEYVVELPEFVFIDDYAHHPAEVSAFLTALKGLYPQKFIQVIFQPHLYSRTRDFATEFSQSLSIADSIILMDIYPAREQPIAGVTSKLILEKIDKKPAALMTRDEILLMLEEKQPDVLATIGAGDIDKLAPEIKALITKTYTT